MLESNRYDSFWISLAYLLATVNQTESPVLYTAREELGLKKLSVCMNVYQVGIV